MDDLLFVLGDADRVRERVEKYLLASELDALSKFSITLTLAMDRLAHDAENAMRAETIMAGGDDLLLCIPRKLYSHAVLQALVQAFQQVTGCTMSFGVGSDVPTAYLNLRRAKSMGGGGIVDSKE